MRNYFLSFIAGFYIISAFGQTYFEPSAISPFLSRYRMSGNQKQLDFSTQKHITAIAIRGEKGKYNVEVNEQLLEVPLDPDSEEPTYFLSLPKAVKTVTLFSNSQGESDIFFIHSGEAAQMEIIRKSQQEIDCISEPPFIEQQIWRAGLPAPNYDRSFTDVQHLIVHHSAGSNSATDYTRVVRDIYLYHTQVNGWSDIGYNFLIAQDGTIFAGRDPAGGDQYTVRGAHFCGKNSGTSGICMLGNYETTNPTEASIISLTELLGFASKKETIVPTQLSFHVDQQLAGIAGHRDGCSTLCPGESIYRLMVEIRNYVSSQLECDIDQDLSFSADRNRLVAGDMLILTNESTGYSEYEFITPGGTQVELYNQANRIGVRYYEEGVYNVALVGTSSFRSDTLYSTSLVEVVEDAIILEPTENGFLVSSEKNYNIYHVYDLQGRILTSGRIVDNEIKFEQGFPVGIWFLKIGHKVFKYYR